MPHKITKEERIERLISYLPQLTEDQIIWVVIQSEFTEEVPLMLKYMAKLVPPNYPRKDYSGLNADLEQLGLALQAACEKHGRRYPLKIIGYQGPNGKPL